MFTGLVEGVGTVRALVAGAAGRRLTVDLGALAEGVRLGDSIAVAGICLTVAALDGTVAAFDLSAETLHRSHVRAWKAGMRVNLERSLRLGDRLGGHFVTGHVDGVGRLLQRDAAGGFTRDLYEAPPELRPLLAEKGSVCVEGVSLTVAALEPDGFAAALIPETLARTTLGTLQPGDPVHLEADLIAKHVARLLGAAVAPPPA